MSQRRRFFSPNSIWNTPVPADAETDPLSEQYLQPWAKEPTGGLHINLDWFTIPVYDVDASTPRRPVRQMATPETAKGRSVTRRWQYRQGPGFGPEVPIPDSAMPDPAGDAHAALVDWERGLAWDMWHAVRMPDGSWESYTGMHYSIDGDGVFDRADFDTENGDSIHYHGPGRAAGVPIIAGLIMHHEILAGRIEHKLALAARWNGLQTFTWPATWTDGRTIGGLPEGAVVQLDPRLDLKPFDLSDGATLIARALQEYGMVNVDTAGGTVVYAEGLYGQPDRSWQGLLDENELKRIPTEHFRVLRMDAIIPMGDARRGRQIEGPE